MFLTCQWDGPNPAPGEWIAGRRGGPLKIRDVHPRPGHQERLVLEVQRPRAGERMPPGAVLHPVSRYASSDPAGPARVRQLARQGESAVTLSRWPDPTDDRPSARAKQRTVRGWRQFCILRQCAEKKGSLITEKHIAAADHLRLLYDLARLGPAKARADEVLPDGMFGPLSGPTTAAEAQAKAAAELRSALDLFTAEQSRMLQVIVLQNRSIGSWCSLEAERQGLAKPLEQRLEMGRLLAVLDILCAHWRDQITLALFGGMV